MKKIISIITIILCFSLGIFSQLPVYLDEKKSVNDRIEDALSRMTLEEKITMCHAQSKFSTPGCPRLGIPELWMSDGPHGVRMEFVWDDWKHAGWTNDSCTAYPALSCLAATFNTELSYRYGKALGEEARFRKKDVILGPGVNIYRTPLSGRNFEYLGEDPFLTSCLVVPYIQGVQENGVAACVKHFALNNQEKWRDSINVVVSERALHEIYLPAFKAAVTEGDVWGVMGSYNKYKGEYCSHNKFLINEILKGDWHFEGVMLTDWGSAHDTNEAALNGLDIEMGTWTDGLTWGISSAYDKYYMAAPLLEKIRNGQLPEKIMDDKIRRILRLNFRTNMDRSRPYGRKLVKEHTEVARQIAEEGIVLLKNDKNFFPIPKSRYRKIAVIGENAVKKLTDGGGSSELKPKREISPLDGLIEKYGVDKIVYSMGYASGRPDYSRVLPSGLDADSLVCAAVKAASEADIVLFFGGLNKNNQQDCEGGDRQNMDLPFGQNELMEKILQVNKNVGIIIISGNAVSMPWIKKVNGVLQSWYLGSEAGSATANVISGEVNPSGKLPFSIPVRLEDNSAHYFGEKSYPGDGKNQEYIDGIFVGYRWHDTKKIPSLFPFGYGLSYTQFSYGKAVTDKNAYAVNDTVKLEFILTNKGGIDGSETVQLYMSQKNPSQMRPVKELKGFRKIFLKAGESKIVSLSVPVREFAFYDEKISRWKIEKDSYLLQVAASSKDIKSVLRIDVLNDNIIEDIVKP